MAIAGAWGYIGRKFLEAARQLGLETSIYDPLPPPSHVDSAAGDDRHFDDEQAFYRQPVDLFHLALHPEQRAPGMRLLLDRSQVEPIWVLCEKPMAAPEHPEQCPELVEAVERSGAIVLYDFPELFDPITARIGAFLREARHVEIDSIVLQRSKDREDPALARNAKRMVHIQYQESVHCLAFILYCLACVDGDISQVLRRGVRVRAESSPYRPPNPSAYPYVVDGKCEFHLSVGQTRIEGCTDFTRGACWSKRREIRGKADGIPFHIVADYLEGRKQLAIQGISQDDVTQTNSYVEVIKSIGAWRAQVPPATLMSGLFPHPTFAHVTYQLSSMLWRSSWLGREIRVESPAELMAFDAGFRTCIPQFPRY